jgi:hypothetical protein
MVCIFAVLKDMTERIYMTIIHVLKRVRGEFHEFVSARTPFFYGGVELMLHIRPTRIPI